MDKQIVVDLREALKEGMRWYEDVHRDDLQSGQPLPEWYKAGRDALHDVWLQDRK